MRWRVMTISSRSVRSIISGQLLQVLFSHPLSTERNGGWLTANHPEYQQLVLP